MSLEPKRKALGRGLSSLIPDSPVLDRTPSSQPAIPASPSEAPIDKIRPNPHQPRQQFRADEIDSLAESIKQSGVLQPLVVRREKDGYTLIAGERRLRAAKQAGLTHVPIVVRDAPDDRLLEFALIENIQRDDLGPIETARAFRELIRNFGLTQAEVSERVGKPRSSVANFLRLLDLPEEIQSSIAAGKLDMGHGRALAGLEDAAQQVRIGKLAAERKMSVREVEERVRRALSGGEQAAKPEPRRDPNLAAAERALSHSLEAGVKIDLGASGRGRIEIRFASEEDLDRLYRQLLRATPRQLPQE